jgi:hypothetical protein
MPCITILGYELIASSRVSPESGIAEPPSSAPSGVRLSSNRIVERVVHVLRVELLRALVRSIPPTVPMRGQRTVGGDGRDVCGVTPSVIHLMELAARLALDLPLLLDADLAVSPRAETERAPLRLADALFLVLPLAPGVPGGGRAVGDVLGAGEAKFLEDAAEEWS